MARVLGKYGATNMLIEYLANPKNRAYREMIRMLGQYGDRSALPLLKSDRIRGTGKEYRSNRKTVDKAIRSIEKRHRN